MRTHARVGVVHKWLTTATYNAGQSDCSFFLVLSNSWEILLTFKQDRQQQLLQQQQQQQQYKQKTTKDVFGT